MVIRFRPGRALLAVRDLLKDPDDLPKVFTLLESTSGRTLERLHARLMASPKGAKLLAGRPDIVDQLADREGLRKLPEGSLGRAYLAFVESEGISPAGIRKAAEDGRIAHEDLPPELAYVHFRMRDTHDLWHAVTGYKGDVLGELTLLAFIFAQTWNPGVAVLVAAGTLRTLSHTALTTRDEGPAARALIRNGYLRGRRAAWLPEQHWEDMLAMPLAEVRAKLGVGEPPVYREIRSSELRAAAA
jgi:ubiquinone biosynthesis protein COQ4